MTIVAFVLGPVGAPFIAVLALVALFAAPSARWLRGVGVALVAATALAWIAYWWFWGVGFETANADLDPRRSTEVTLGVTELATAVGSLLLAAVAFLTRRRPAS